MKLCVGLLVVSFGLMALFGCGSVSEPGPVEQAIARMHEMLTGMSNLENDQQVADAIDRLNRQAAGILSANQAVTELPAGSVDPRMPARFESVRRQWLKACAERLNAPGVVAALKRAGKQSFLAEQPGQPSS